MASNEKTMRIDGIPSRGSPFSSAKESMTSNPRGSSIAVNSMLRPRAQPCGDVMWYFACPPTVKSNASNVAGHPGGPQKRSS